MRSDGADECGNWQLFCDPDAGEGKPLDYFVLEEGCHYSVTWPSKYGCPVKAGWLPGGPGAALLTYAAAGALLRSPSSSVPVFPPFPPLLPPRPSSACTQARMAGECLGRRT